MPIDLTNWVPKKLIPYSGSPVENIVTKEIWDSSWTLGIEQGNWTADAVDQLLQFLTDTIWTTHAGDFLKITATDSLTKVLTDIQNAHTAHLADHGNPHQVTKAQVGLGSVDNTSDINKPVSTATQAALNLKANTADMTAALALKADNNNVIRSIVGQGGAMVTIDNANGLATINVTGTGGDMLQANYQSGAGLSNNNKVDHAMWADNASLASLATKLQTGRVISLSGDASGTVTFDGSANVSLAVAVADDSHNHIISNIDNLQTTLDGKQSKVLKGTTTPSAATGNDGDLYIYYS